MEFIQPHMLSFFSLQILEADRLTHARKKQLEISEIFSHANSIVPFSDNGMEFIMEYLLSFMEFMHGKMA